MNAEQYLQERVDSQIDWLEGRSASNQAWYRRLRVLELICASSIPLLVGYAGEEPWIKFVVGLLGVLIAILAGCLSLFKFQENWVEYRAAGEALKREKYLFLTRAEPYQADTAFAHLVARVEGSLSAENTRWMQHIGQSGGGNPASEVR